MHVIDWERPKVFDRENNQRLRKVKEAVRISQSPHIMNWGQGEHNLSDIYRPLFTTRNQSTCKQTLRGEGHSLMMVLDEN